MVQRTVKMIGRAYSTSGDVHVQATYNGIEISTGPVATIVTDVIPRPAELPALARHELFQFETTTDTTGQIPVVISVTGGTLFFNQLLMNYSGFEEQRQAIDPDIPVNPEDPSTFNWVVTVEPNLYYADPNTNTAESDGISNLTKNGEPWAWRVNVGNLLGDWTYPIHDGETVTFDFFVDPNKLRLRGPIY